MKNSARTRARQFAVQALYQTLVGGHTIEQADAFTRLLSGFHKADAPYFVALLESHAMRSQLENHLAPYLHGRTWQDVSPIERVILWLGCFELLHRPDIPWRVVVDEAVELAKQFGGTEGHRFVNGILHPLVHQLRADEIQSVKKPLK